MRLTDQDIVNIREQYAQGTRQVVLASQYKVTQTYISKIVRQEKRAALLGRSLTTNRCIDCNTRIRRDRKRCSACFQQQHYCCDCGTPLSSGTKQERCVTCRETYLRTYWRNHQRQRRSQHGKEQGGSK